MNINGTGSLSSQVSPMQTGDAVGVLVLDKAQKMEGQAALQLVAALPQPTYNNPPNLGQSVDLFV